MGKRENVKIILDGFNAEPPLSDDAILEQLYDGGNGVPFADLRTVFNDIIKEKGLRLSNKERKIKTGELLDGTEKIEDHEAALKLVAMLQDKLKVTSTKALGSLRSWCKEYNVTMPKVPSVAKTRKVGFGGHYEKIFDFILANRESDKKAIVAFCHANGIPETYTTTALNVVHFAKRWNGEIVDEPEAEPEAEKETA